MIEADQYDWRSVIVVDSGLTEVAPGSATVIGLWPMYRSEASKIVKRLQALK
jgi:peptidyl-tRNA hydrolase